MSREQFTPAHGHFDRLKRHRTRVSSVCHINEMKQQRQTRHQAAVFGEVLHNDRMLFLPQFAVLQRAPPLEEPLLSCILESEVRRFGASSTRAPHWRKSMWANLPTMSKARSLAMKSGHRSTSSQPL